MPRADISELRARWERMRCASGTGHECDEERDSMFARLVKAYSEPHRHYHTLDHVLACLFEFDRLPARASYLPTALAYAIWFHDAIYDPRRHDNEARSAELASDELAALQYPQAFRRMVRELILATEHRPLHRMLHDQPLMIDIDLAIFGQPDDVFDAYERAIRIEYAHVDESTYRVARAAILKRFLHRPRVYLTDWFAARYGSKARENLRRSIRALTGR